MHRKWSIILLLLLVCNYHLPSAQDFPHSVIAAASDRYSSPSLLKRIILGSNYRKEWETKVAMPVFDLRKTNLRIVRMGGGQQTTSLELVDDQGREWALRSVDKNVKAPKKFMRNTFMERIIQDFVSAAYPYAGLSIPDLSNAAGVPAGEQRLYFVPDDTIFGEHREAMANKVFILVNNQPMTEENITTTEMNEELKTRDNCCVDQKEYLKARLVDWLIADWDRHDDQWRWYRKRSGERTVFYIVPRDRDQAFFNSNGWLAKLVSLFLMPHLRGFKKKSTGIKRLSKKTRAYDLRFTSELKKEDWERIIKEFQRNITDGVIEAAIKKQPKEIVDIRGDQMIEKLKSRRDGLLKNALKYYSWLDAKRPRVTGSGRPAPA